ncbi:helix-turn-helix transcriptional regulator [Rhodopseudomonas sp. P2A-2r]|uniref:helix-turn-helix transcriptional regulator n=1 Tax=Rhodopseudomonas sp. P2A-2r TaxID=2991972 RepID=UPI0022343D5F|nr:helix-turn-helix transcriptional regulator [Rhodopseudomonas sp. P2A-2r]UZE48614.1 helix-turn-helix transcriptional regulator [Rhodopseudomonas sp. P2A-2r]
MFDSVNFEALVDEIYEAGVVPDRWPLVFDKLAGIADGEGAMMFAIAPGIPRWCSSAAIHERIDRWTKSPFAQNNPRNERLLPNIESRFLTDLDKFTREELDNEKFYTDILRPGGLGWCVGTSIRAPSGDMLVLSVEKAFAKGPVPRETAEQLDHLRPHLARAAVLAGRLGFDRARTAIATLEMIGLPAAAVTRNGRLVAANPAFLTVSATVGVGARDQVQFTAPAIQSMFVEALGKPVSLARTGRSIPVAATSASPPLIVHVLPLRLAGLDVFTGAVSIVFLTAITQQGSPAPELLQALFDLTPAEARIASMLIDGHSLSGISKLQNVSLNTVRTQLKSVFAKTGVDRQVDLVRLLGQRRVRVA